MSIIVKEKTETIILATLDELVPQNHLVRKLEEYVNWSFIYDLTDHLYSDKGRGRVDPVILFKMVFINKIFGVNSMRQTCEEVKVNVAYRWFLGITFDDTVPNYSTYSKNYDRKFKNADIAEKVFQQVLIQLIDKNLIDVESVFIDGTHIKANANKNKYTKEEIVVDVSKIYQEELVEEICKDRVSHGKKQLKKKR